MKKNMGAADRILRIVIALVVGLLYLGEYISGIQAIILGVLAVVFLLTSFISFCPLYVPFGWNTRRPKEE